MKELITVNFDLKNHKQFDIKQIVNALELTKNDSRFSALFGRLEIRYTKFISLEKGIFDNKYFTLKIVGRKQVSSVLNRVSKVFNITSVKCCGDNFNRTFYIS